MTPTNPSLNIQKPYQTYDLYGHKDAEQTLLQACKNNKLHHAWIIGGIESIGKATLAWRFARYLLNYPNINNSLFIDKDNIHSQKISNLTHPSIAFLYKRWNENTQQFNNIIPIDDIRKLKKIFTQTTNNSYRIAIIDSIEDLNLAGMNCLLKLLEEPLEKSIFLIISHQPQMILPTIRSRCIQLNLQNLTNNNIIKIINKVYSYNNLTHPENSTITKILNNPTISSGSIAKTLYFLNQDKLDFYNLLNNLKENQENTINNIVDNLASKNQIAEYSMFTQTLLKWLNIQAKKPTISLQESYLYSKLWYKINNNLVSTKKYNLDKRLLLTSTLNDIKNLITKLPRLQLTD